VRARPFHVDVRLIGGRRVRFMSALIQVSCVCACCDAVENTVQTVVVELAQRASLPCDGGVVFEPNTRRFKVFDSDADDVTLADDEHDFSQRAPPALTSPPAVMSATTTTTTTTTEMRDVSALDLASSGATTARAQSPSRKHSSARDALTPRVASSRDDDNEGSDTNTSSAVSDPVNAPPASSAPSASSEFVRKRSVVAAAAAPVVHGITDVKTRVGMRVCVLWCHVCACNHKFLAIAKQDADVDEISEVLSELKLVATVMERELERCVCVCVCVVCAVGTLRVRQSYVTPCAQANRAARQDDSAGRRDARTHSAHRRDDRRHDCELTSSERRNG
jgi:hypothetical protein